MNKANECNGGLFDYVELSESSYAEKKQQDCIMCKFFYISHFNVYLKPNTNHHTENVRSLSHTLPAINSRRCFGGSKSRFQLCIWKLEWAHDGDTLWASAVTFVTGQVAGSVNIATPKVPFSSAIERTAASDARHTHTHCWAVNIDMVCELSAALLCLCTKNYKSLCKKFANFFFFSLLRFARLLVIIIQRDSKVVVAFKISLGCVLQSYFSGFGWWWDGKFLGDSSRQLLRTLLVRFTKHSHFKSNQVKLICRQKLL